MKKLIVLANWDRPLEKTWSGTTFSLTQALKKYYDVDVKDLNIPRFLTRIDFCSRIPLIGVFFGWLYDLLLSKRANKIIGPDHMVPVLEICDDVFVRNPYYTYQDMTYMGGIYVKELKSIHPYLYNAALQGLLPSNEIQRRVHRQEKEYVHAKGIFWMGEWLDRFMKEKYPELKMKMFHVGGGTNVDVNKVDVTCKEGNKFLFIGRAHERKALDIVFKAFAILKKENHKYELHIAGPENNPYPNVEGVFYYGDADKNMVSNLFNMCDVFCMPSRFEAYGLVFVESLIYGLPCVARKFFEMPYFIEEGKEGYLIENDDPQEYAILMNRAIHNNEMKEYINSRRGYYIEKYTWDAVAKRIKQVVG